MNRPRLTIEISEAYERMTCGLTCSPPMADSGLVRFEAAFEKMARRIGPAAESRHRR